MVTDVFYGKSNFILHSFLFITISNKTLKTAYTIHTQTILDGVNIAYVDEGKGDSTILFVHGLGHTHLAWWQNIAQLQHFNRCIAIDLPGSGQSSAGNYNYSLHFFADCIFHFIQQKKLKNVFIAGHSMGGQIAMIFALKYPEAAQGLILCAPAGLETFNEWEKNLYRNTMFFMDLVSNEENSLRKAIQSSFYILPENANSIINALVQSMKTQNLAQYRRMTEDCIKAMLDEPVYDRLYQINLPVQIIFGEKDSMIPNRFIHPVSTTRLAEMAADKFPDATLEMIPQCGHFVQWEKAAKVNGLIRHFVSIVMEERKV